MRHRLPQERLLAQRFSPRQYDLPANEKGCYFYFTMVDQLASAESCQICGARLEKAQDQNNAICVECATASPNYSLEGASSLSGTSAEFDFGAAPPQDLQPDPDRPPWGPITGIGVWMISVAAIVIVPILAVAIWYFVEAARGKPPNLASQPELLEWLKSPNLLLVQVLSTIVAHAITIAICWAVVTRLGKRPFWQSLGWSWAGHSVWYWLVFSACVLAALYMATALLSRFIPQSEQNSFTELLKSSQRVRIAVAALAIFTAPLVEETVYRGLLYSSFRRSLGISLTIAVVTMMFAGVHILQYLGAWVSISGLTLLSLALTIVRARTKSILPCVIIHTFNNAFSSVLILTGKQ